MAVTVANGLDALGPSRTDADHLTALVGRQLGRPVADTTIAVDPIAHEIGAIATGGLYRVSGQAVTDAGVLPWSMFVKRLHSARMWPLIDVIPEPLREHWITEFPWRVEIDYYRSRVADLLPTGLRLPAVYDIVEHDPDRATIWMEDVAADDGEWSIKRFAQAAHGLGVLAGRRPIDTDVVFGFAPGNREIGGALRHFAFGRVQRGFGAHLADERIWATPALAEQLSSSGAADLRDVLASCLTQLPDWLDAMDALPQTYHHGDASPQNLLVPVDAPDTFVLIDPGFNTPQCVGFDLGQLLIGLVHLDRLDPDRLAEIYAAIVPAYVDGLLSTDFAATAADVAEGARLALLVRGLFTALPLEQLEQPDAAALRDLVATRIRLTHFLLGLTQTT
jgi:hypothetical protein